MGSLDAGCGNPDPSRLRSAPPSRCAAIAIALLAVGAARPVFAKKAQGCPPGQSVSEDTDGHCCWPGQAWSHSRRVCLGTPTRCPRDHRLEKDRCVPNPQVAGGAGSDAASPGGRPRCPAGMTLIPGGTFEMGEDGDTVTVRPFCLDRTEVTVRAYSECVEDGSCRKPTEGDVCVYGELARENHPVNCVTWREAAGFCQRLGKRLPSEEEWEWAARGRERAWAYPFGDEIRHNQVCWRGMDCIREDYRGRPRPDAHMWTCRVGEHPAGDSPDGIHDLAGNVAEWTSSGDGDGRIIRGGSFNSNDAAKLTASFRLELPPEAKKGVVGFRCAAPPIR